MSIDTVKESLSNLVSSWEINNKTQEELSDILYNFYLSLKYSNEHQNNNSAIVRTLSNNEYDKYIKNGNLDGTITKANTSVWHHDTMKYSGSGYLISVSSRPQHVSYECTQTNNGNKARSWHIYSTYSNKFLYYTGDGSRDVSYNQHLQYVKNFIREEIWTDDHYWQGYLIDRTNNFRPAFTYLDNNKSIDVFRWMLWFHWMI